MTGEAESTPSFEMPEEVLWLRATLVDFDAVDFESPIRDALTADPYEISRLFQHAAKLPDGANDTPAARVFSMLAAIMDMHFKPHEQHEPFAAKLVFADGNRSAVPADFRAYRDLLSQIASRSRNLILRARLAGR